MQTTYKKTGTLSCLILFLILPIVINIFPDIYNGTRNSIIFSSGYSAILLVFVAVFFTRISRIRFSAIDLFLCIVALVYIFRASLNIQFFSFCGLSLVYIVFRCGKINYHIVFIAIFASILLLSGIGYLQLSNILTTTDSRYIITGPYANSSIYGGVLCLLLALIVPIMFSSNKYAKTWIYLSVFSLLFAFPTLVISNARASWVALASSLILQLYMKYKRSVRKMAYKTKAMIILFSAIVILSIMYRLYELKPDSAQGRILIWKVCLQMINDKPLIGFGEKGFEANYMLYQAKYLKEQGTERDKYVAGNNHLVFDEPIRVFVEYGLSGIALYIAFICVVFSLPIRSGVISRSSFSFLIAFFVWGLFSYPDKIHSVMLLLTIILGTMSAKSKKYIGVLRVNAISSILLKITLATGMLFLTILFTVYHNHYFRFQKLFSNRNKMAQQEMVYELDLLAPIMEKEIGFVALYTHLTYLNKNDAVFVQWLSKWELLFPVSELYILKGDYMKSIGEYKQAESYYLLSHFMVPSMQKARSRLVFLYKEMGEYIKAKQIAIEILAEDVKIYGFETYRLHRELREVLYLKD